MDPRREAASRILRGYGSFLKRQETDLNDLFKKIDVLSYERPKCFSPADLTIAPFERLPIAQVIQSDNKVLNKIVAVFSILCEQIVHLQNEARQKHFIFLAFYQEHFKSGELSPEEFICGRLDKLVALASFVKRCYEVIANLCNQMVALYGGNFINLKGTKFDYILSHLGDILVTLITIECLIVNSPVQNHWSLYRKAVKSISKNPTVKNPKSVDTVLDNVENVILTDKLFQNCLDSARNIKGSINKSNFTVVDDSISYVRKYISELEKVTIDYCESSISSLQWIKVNALFVFNFHVFGNADKKLLKSLLEINIKAHTVPLYGLSVWHPEQFLLRYVGVLCTAPQKLSQSLMKARQSYIFSKKQTLLKDVYNAQIQSAKWAFEIIQAFSTGETQLNVVNMNHRLDLLMQGITFASQINYTVTSFMNIHISHNLSITKSSLMAICKLIEILKGMLLIFKDNFISVASSVNLIVQHLLYQIISQLSMAKKKFMSDKNYTNYLDELTAVVIAERSLRGPPTIQRRIVGNVALSIVPSSAFPDDGYFKIASLLEKLESIINIHARMKSLCYCLFLYWHKSVIPIYLQSIFNSKKDMMRFQFIINALNDCSKTVYECDQNFAYKKICDNFKDETLDCINDSLIKPLGQQIETNLRLQVHSHLQLDSINPFLVPVEDNFPLLRMRHFQLENSYISIKSAVEHYLSFMFYNLTTVVLHDWRTYGEMRQLAKFKFNLTTVEDNLPTQTLEQGLDVLEIMRNIPVFVSKYLYNLNNQVFIEQNSNNKYLNTISICHIANSIRTHGTGIMNTTVNFTYQFLKKKFHIFSQFMYDEQIKSRLIKDMRTFREASFVSKPMYSYKRAEKFNKSIRNLGLNEDGKTYLDLFRLLISHIGNAMGYVRMVRSGGLHCCANATTFLPSLNDESYEFLLKRDETSALVKESLENLDSTINNLTSNFSQGTDYFKLLVNAFVPVFRSTDQAHLKPFYMIIPPLTINFVENMLLSKDKMSKKNKTGAAFTDDGFAMGLAYILKLLDQDENMDSLNWFNSVNQHIKDERKSITEQISTGSDHLHHALALTEKKLNVLEQEFQLLYFSFSSARIFFQ